MLLVKIHKSYRDVIAICDKDLVGKYYEEDKFQLDIKESFYGGDKVNKEKAIEIMKFHSSEDATFNIVGEKAIKCAIEVGIISEKSVGKIDGVPFALVLL